MQRVKPWRERRNTLAKAMEKQLQNTNAIEDDGPTDPRNYVTAFMLRASTAAEMAQLSTDLVAEMPYSGDALEMARTAAMAWTELADVIEQKPRRKLRAKKIT